LSLPDGGYREDVIQRAPFEDYFRDNIDRWFSRAKEKGFVKRMEDLILVSGCTLVPSWAAAVSMDRTMEADISLASTKLSDGRTDFVWSNIRGPVVYHNSVFDPVRFLGYIYSACTDFFWLHGKRCHDLPRTLDQCIFIRGLAGRRTWSGYEQIGIGATPSLETLTIRIQVGRRLPGVPKPKVSSLPCRGLQVADEYEEDKVTPEYKAI
jgi:hypothetical protein